MSIELQIADEDMMDLSVPDDMEPENESVQPAEAPKEAKSVAENSDLEEDLLAKVKQLKHLFGIPDDLEPSKKWHEDIRLNVVHVQGVQDMSSDDVLEYFKAFDPASLEWVNDTSCNVVFDDALTASRAIARLVTHRISTADAHADASVSTLIPPIEAGSLKETVPDGLWLLGMEHEKAKQLLIRYAKPDDKKKSGAGKYSEYYRKYGNPHYGGKKQLMSSSLAEKLKNMSEMEGGLEEDDDADDGAPVRSDRDQSPVSPPRKPLGLRMKMRADDEEEENGRPRTFDKYKSESDKKSVWDRLEKPSALDRLDKPSVLDRIGSSSRVIQRKRGNAADASGALSVWSRLSLEPQSSSSGRKDGKKRSVLYSNIRIKK